MILFVLLYTYTLFYHIVDSIALVNNVDNDLSLFKYTKDGDIAQVKYASKNIQSISPKICFHDQDTDCIVLLSLDKMKRSILSIPIVSNFKSYNIDHMKLHIDDNLGYIFALLGYIPDCEYLMNYIDSIIQNHCLMYGERPNMEYLSSHIATWITRGLYRSNNKQDDVVITRPLATSILLLSSIPEYCDVEHKYQHKIWQVDCTGLITQRKFSILGDISDSIQEQIYNILSKSTSTSIQSDVHSKDCLYDGNGSNNNNVIIEGSLVSKVTQLLECFKDKIADNDTGDEESYHITCCMVVPSYTYPKKKLTDDPIIPSTKYNLASDDDTGSYQIVDNGTIINESDAIQSSKYNTFPTSRILKSSPLPTIKDVTQWIKAQFLSE